jgi:hypothetical protein
VSPVTTRRRPPRRMHARLRRSRVDGARGADLFSAGMGAPMRAPGQIFPRAN